MHQSKRDAGPVFSPKNTVFQLLDKTDGLNKEIFLKFYGRGPGLSHPSTRDILGMAGTMHHSWWKKDEKGRVYYIEQAIRRMLISTATIATFTSNHSHDICAGAIYPLALKGESLDDIPRTSAKVTGNGKSTTNDPKGKIFICPQVSSIIPGIPRILVVEGVFVRAAYRVVVGKTKWVGVYTRPGNYDEYCKKNGEVKIEEYLTMHAANGRHVDPIIGMHETFGAEIKRIDANACPCDKGARGYNVVMDYTPHLLANLDLILKEKLNPIFPT
ncbi:MAG: hypothetical protein WC717_03995 [Candidatus Micrarchaeia archaeon]|jgi:hypothetical protein